MVGVLIDDMNSENIITVTANGTLTVACPVAVYKDKNGALYGIKVALDSNSDITNCGMALETKTTGLACKVQMTGVLVGTSGGTADQLVTAVSNAGALTTAAVADTNADLGAILGTCTAAGSFLKKIPV